jgi:hypothetical protein
MEYCWQGCHESGGDGENDVCNSKFLRWVLVCMVS